MWEELSQFLFSRNTILGWEYENWMLVIGLPIAIFFAYVSQRGWR
jgi:hypothetical protein